MWKKHFQKYVSNNLPIMYKIEDQFYFYFQVSGRYTCKAKNIAGEATTTAVNTFFI